MDTKGRKVFLDFNDSTIIRVNVDNSMRDSSNIQRAERQAKLHKSLKKNSRLRSTTMTKIHYPDSLLSRTSAANVKFNQRKIDSKEDHCTSSNPRRPTRRVTKENVLKFFEVKAICSRPTVAIKSTNKLDPLPTQPINFLVYKKPSVEAPSPKKTVDNWRKEARLLPPIKDETAINPEIYVPPMMRLSKVKDIVVQTKPIELSFKPVITSSPNSTLQPPPTKKSSEKKPKTNPSKTLSAQQKIHYSKNKWTASQASQQHSYNKKTSKSPATQAQDRLLNVQKSISDDDSSSESKSKTSRCLSNCLEKLQIVEELNKPKEATKKTNFLCERLRVAQYEECPKPIPLRRPYMKPQ